METCRHTKNFNSKLVIPLCIPGGRGCIKHLYIYIYKCLQSCIVWIDLNFFIFIFFYSFFISFFIYFFFYFIIFLMPSEQVPPPEWRAQWPRGHSCPPPPAPRWRRQKWRRRPRRPRMRGTRAARGGPGGPWPPAPADTGCAVFGKEPAEREEKWMTS